MKTRFGAGAWALAAMLILTGGPSLADERRIEEVGAVPLGEKGSRSGSAYDDAKAAGLRAAVERVAQEFLDEAPRPDGGEREDVDLEKVLGSQMVPYTTRFRVLEDQGERPAVFSSKGARTEYVVVVEVFVDADRVRQRLVDAGLVEDDTPAGVGSRIEVELRGVDRYGAVNAVRDLLAETAGATTVVPVEFDRGVAVLDVALPGEDADSRELAEDLVRADVPGLSLRAVELDRERVVLQVRWQPPDPKPE